MFNDFALPFAALSASLMSGILPYIQQNLPAHPNASILPLRDLFLDAPRNGLFHLIIDVYHRQHTEHICLDTSGKQIAVHM